MSNEISPLNSSVEETTNAVEEVLAPLEPLSIFDLCETDDALSEDGKWFSDIFAPGDGISIKLRRMTSRRSVNYRTVLMKKYQRYQKKGEFPPEIDERMMIEQLAEVIIVDWKGIRGRDGKEIPYTKQMAVQLCKMSDFRLPLIQLAAAGDSFRSDKETEGNS